MPDVQEKVRLATCRAMAIVEAFETQIRRSLLVDVSGGMMADAAAMKEFYAEQGLHVPSHRLSADLILRSVEDARLIEVKSRGGWGPISVPQRQYDTFDSAGDCSWLYVVWNVTQPGPFALTAVCDPTRLAWVHVPHPSPATRKQGGVASEDTFTVEAEEIQRHGISIDLTQLELPGWEQPDWLQSQPSNPSAPGSAPACELTVNGSPAHRHRQDVLECCRTRWMRIETNGPCLTNGGQMRQSKPVGRVEQRCDPFPWLDGRGVRTTRRLRAGVNPRDRFCGSSDQECGVRGADRLAGLGFHVADET